MHLLGIYLFGSSLQLIFSLVGICSFRQQVYYEWWWISWTRIYVFHYDLVLPNLIFLKMVLSKLMNISTFGPSSSPSNSFAILLIDSAFCYVLLVSIFNSKIVQVLLHLVVGMFLCHIPQLVARFFVRCFGISCFVCIVLPFVDIFLIFLLFPVFSGLFPQFVLLFFVVLLFLFYTKMFQRFSFVLSFLHVSVDFLSTFPVEFPIQVLIFC